MKNNWRRLSGVCIIGVQTLFLQWVCKSAYTALPLSQVRIPQLSIFTRITMAIRKQHWWRSKSRLCCCGWVTWHHNEGQLKAFHPGLCSWTNELLLASQAITQLGLDTHSIIMTVWASTVCWAHGRCSDVRLLSPHLSNREKHTYWWGRPSWTTLHKLLCLFLFP